MIKGDIRTDRAGEILTNCEGYSFKIVEYRSCKSCDVQFENGTIIKNREYTDLLKGAVKNPYHKSVLGVGYYGVGIYKAKINDKHTDSYLSWRSMLSRCYDEKYQEKQLTYIGCTVAEEWQNFQNFAKWREENYKSHMEKWELDKDILCKDCKTYSPETCCFVPKYINRLFSGTTVSKITPSVGVRKDYNKFNVRVTVDGKRISIAGFDTEEEASKVYKTYKETEIKRVAEEWKDKIAENVYQALINYKI